ncbi:hypothetical protein [Bathymodiolus japonicus methanotrophic gill symbiont]|uniref:hypothetical protein n=1 Tax=Bathymodiolus japonicus methanotrophic gill symbiont TaxID=113269 RepID=UPI001C8DFE67|nr:hypothetical protein [Bathymodiolus japonicus methanotrophic gill symbiont]
MAKTVQQKARSYTVNLYGKQREVRAYSRVVMLKTLKRPVQVVWGFRHTQWIALFTTDLSLSVTISVPLSIDAVKLTSPQESS